MLILPMLSVLPVRVLPTTANFHIFGAVLVHDTRCIIAIGLVGQNGAGHVQIPNATTRRARRMDAGAVDTGPMVTLALNRHSFRAAVARRRHLYH
jgi:hypothetical protein